MNKRRNLLSGTCGMYGREDVFVAKPEKDNVEDLSLDCRVILKCVLNK